jgi:hypothetical protein
VTKKISTEAVVPAQTDGEDASANTQEALPFRDRADLLAELRTELYHVNRRYLVDPEDEDLVSRRRELAEGVTTLMDELAVERAGFMDDLRRRVQDDVLAFFRSLGYGSAGLPAIVGEGLDALQTALSQVANQREHREVPSPPPIDVATAQQQKNQERHGLYMTDAELQRYQDDPDSVHGLGYRRIRPMSREEQEAQRRRVLTTGEDIGEGVF